MTGLGYQGAMINGQTNGAYPDEDRFSPVWERAEDLGDPIYIHPANPIHLSDMYRDHSEPFDPVWSWEVETANHAVRLVFGGIFDRLPFANPIRGHMGEALPLRLPTLAVRQPVENLQSKGANAQAAALGKPQTQSLDHDLGGLFRRTAPLCLRGAWRRPGPVSGRPPVRAVTLGSGLDRKRGHPGGNTRKDLFRQRQSPARASMTSQTGQIEE